MVSTSRVLPGLNRRLSSMWFIHKWLRSINEPLIDKPICHGTLAAKPAKLGKIGFACRSKEKRRDVQFMKFANLKKVAAGWLTASLLCFTFDASAITLSFGDASSVGHIYFNRINPPNSNPSTEAASINTLLGLAPSPHIQVIGGQIHNLLNDFGGSLPAAVADPTYSSILGNEGSGNTGIDVTGYTYLLGKYNGQNGGLYIWYVGGLTAVQVPVNIPATSVPWAANGGGNGYGLSHWRLYTPTSVPDGGTTVLLLGAALTALGFVSRRLRNS